MASGIEIFDTNGKLVVGVTTHMTVLIWSELTYFGNSEAVLDVGEPISLTTHVVCFPYNFNRVAYASIEDGTKIRYGNFSAFWGDLITPFNTTLNIFRIY